MSKYFLETISPIHIGNGNKYSNKEFIIKNGLLTRVDTGKIYETIEHENARDDFILFLEDQYTTLKDFIGNDIPSNSRLYIANLACDNMPLEISEFIKENNISFIPGSSIKGAIRTAILYNMISENDINELRIVLQYGENTERFLNKIISGNTKFSSYSDILKFVQISDSNNINKIEIICEQILETMFDKWNWYKRRNNIAQSYLETIPTDIKVEGNIIINSYDILLEKLGLSYKGKILNFDKIKEMIYTLSKDLINYEIEFAEKYSIEFLSTFYKKIQKLNTKDAPLIKIGHGAGFMSMTIGLKLKNDYQLFEKVRTMTKGKSYPYEFPKTRKIDIDRHIPLGWCKLEVK